MMNFHVAQWWLAVDTEIELNFNPWNNIANVDLKTSYKGDQKRTMMPIFGKMVVLRATMNLKMFLRYISLYQSQVYLLTCGDIQPRALLYLSIFTFIKCLYVYISETIYATFINCTKSIAYDDRAHVCTSWSIYPALAPTGHKSPPSHQHYK